MKIATRTDRSPAKVSFLRQFATDLRRLGFGPKLVATGRTLTFTCLVRAITRRRMQALCREIRRSQLLASASFLNEIEERRISELLIRGSDLDPHAVSPNTVLCQSKDEKAIYRYARLMQAVPSNNRVGRQMSFLVFDEGQRHRTLIGAIGLASPVYTIRCRDSYFCWSGSRPKRNKGLRRTMDVAACVALPPYSYLLGGKLLASLAASDLVADAFRSRYRTTLLALTTTCATGLHAPIFNRIMLVRGGLYRRVGATVGFTTSLYSSDTMAEARQVLESRGVAEMGDLHTWNAVRILRTALEVCAIPADPFLRIGRPKGVYVALLSEESLGALRRGRSITRPQYLSAGQCLSYWRGRLLPNRLARSDVANKLKRFAPSRILLTKALR